ncbi:MAG: hypothetical protein M4D80_13280 [Myxococcota bacterium]|nr:hypothetical protein [Myxococcota bacterium]
MPFENVLPVLRTSAIARAEGKVFHCEVPADRELDTPLLAFACDGIVLTRADVAAGGTTPDDLYRTALANLAKRRGSWRVEQLAGGFMGLGKKTAQVMSLVNEYAVEHILLDGFIDEVERMMPGATFFAPRRGTLRCATPQFVAREREMARVSFERAEKDGKAGKAGIATVVCPMELVRSPIVGQMFALGARFAGTETPYAPATGPRRAITAHDGPPSKPR